MKYSKQEVEEARTQLLNWLKPGDTVYTILRDVSRSGMSRKISVLIQQKGCGFIHPNYAVAAVLGYKLNSGFNDSITLGGCGMDMGFHLVYSLSSALFRGNFKCIGKKEGCPSNDHNNEHMHERNPQGCPIIKKGQQHSDGGYALKQAWL